MGQACRDCCKPRHRLLAAAGATAAGGIARCWARLRGGRCSAWLLSRHPAEGGLAAAGWLAVSLTVAGCNTPVASNLTENAANEVVVALQAEGIAARKRNAAGAGQLFQIWVPRPSAGRALAVLVGNELPRRGSDDAQPKLGASLLPSRSQDRLRVGAALSASLEASLESVDRVLGADVHVSLARPGAPLGAPARPARASVLLRYRGSPAPLETAEIRRLLAGAIDGLAEQDVAIVLKRAAEAPTPAPPGNARFGPIETTPESLPWLRALTAAIAGLNAAMASLLWMVWRRGKAPHSQQANPR